MVLFARRRVRSIAARLGCGYDDLYRLTGAAYTGAISATYDYEYDSVGNMTAFTETVTSTRSVERTFDGANQLTTSFDVDAGTTSYTYDGNGNLTVVYPPGSDAQNPVGALQYAYDQRNMLITHTTYVSGTGWVLQTAYVYDGANDRLQQVDHTSGTAVTTTYTNDVVGLTQVLAADDGTSQVYNLFGLDLISQDGGSEVRTLLADGLGSVRLELAGGSVDAVTTYSPYGEVLAQSGTSGTVYGFTGEQEDEATGLLYLRARYYNSTTYQFQTRDSHPGYTTLPQSQNGYSYAHSNPVKYTDPSGHCIVGYSGEVRMSEYPYGTSGICPDTEHVIVEGNAAMRDLYPPPSPRIIQYSDMVAYQPYINQAAADYGIPPISLAAGIMHQGSGRIRTLSRWLTCDLAERVQAYFPVTTRATGEKASVGLAQLTPEEIPAYLPGCDIGCLFQTEYAIEGLAAKIAAADDLLPEDTPPLERLMVLAQAQNNGPRAAAWYNDSLEEGVANWTDVRRSSPGNWDQLGFILQATKYLYNTGLFYLPPGVTESDLETWEYIFNNKGRTPQ